ncbi:MAG: hypothetical protein ACOYMQ_18770 [Pseudanabaena sp.]
MVFRRSHINFSHFAIANNFSKPNNQVDLLCSAIAYQFLNFAIAITVSRDYEAIAS